MQVAGSAEKMDFAVLGGEGLRMGLRRDRASLFCKVSTKPCSGKFDAERDPLGAERDHTRDLREVENGSKPVRERCFARATLGNHTIRVSKWEPRFVVLAFRLWPKP